MDKLMQRGEQMELDAPDICIYNIYYIIYIYMNQNETSTAWSLRALAALHVAVEPLYERLGISFTNGLESSRPCLHMHDRHWPRLNHGMSWFPDVFQRIFLWSFWTWHCSIVSSSIVNFVGMADMPWSGRDCCPSWVGVHMQLWTSS